MSTTVEVRELPNRFAEVMALAAAGGEVILTEKQVPMAKLVPLPSGNHHAPNQVMLDVLGAIEKIQQGMRTTDDKNTGAYLREARAGGMYGHGSDK